MSTETHTNALPEDVAAALATHEQAKAAYLAQRETLIALGKRLEKHRAAASAARHESETAGSEWRAAFRAADGDPKPEILKVKRAELDKRELAESYEELASELEPSYQLAQLDAVDARKRYVYTRDQAATLYEDHRFAAASAAMFASDEGRAWLQLAGRQQPRHLRAVLCEGMIASSDCEQAARGRFERSLATLVDAAGTGLEPADADLHEQALQVLPAVAYELTGQEASSPTMLARKRANLLALLEEKGAQHSA